MVREVSVAIWDKLVTISEVHVVWRQYYNIRISKN